MSTLTQLLPVFVKKEDQYFQKIDKFNQPKKEKLDYSSLETFIIQKT